MKVGDRVRLNDDGLICVYGSVSGHQYLKRQIHVITRIDEESVTSDIDTFHVEVADPDLNQYLLVNRFFNLVPSHDQDIR